SGVAISLIMGAVLKPLLALMVAGVLLGEYAAPYSENLAESRRALAIGSGEAVQSKGLWHREDHDVIHINAVQTNGVLHGITRYRFDDQRELIETSFAHRASVQGEDWLLEDVAPTLFEPDGTSRVEQHAQQRWDVGLSPRLLRVVLLDPDVLPLTGIWHYQNYLAEQGL